jgi:hypothetical protein
MEGEGTDEEGLLFVLLFVFVRVLFLEFGEDTGEDFLLVYLLFNSCVVLLLLLLVLLLFGSGELLSFVSSDDPSSLFFLLNRLPTSAYED